MSQSEDMDAINRYMMRMDLMTGQAAQHRDAWVVWYDNLSWWERTQDGAIYDEARNRRNEFNLANAVTPEEKAGVLHVMQTGMTTEEMAGGTRRTLSSGMYSLPETTIEGKTDLLTFRGKVALALLGVASASLYAGKVYLSKHYKLIKSKTA
jgi:hypothetical protein